jgi:hypothetical protein
MARSAARGPALRAGQPAPSGVAMPVSDALTFGVFPFGLAGGPGGVAAGPPDDFGQIRRLLRVLRGGGAELLVRVYVAWSGPDTTGAVLGRVADLVRTGRRSDLHWDLVLAYRDRQADIDAWTDFVRRVVTGFGADLATIQVTGEANLTGVPDAGDGGYPGAVEALVHGLSAAADAKQEHALDVPVGFAVVPEPAPAAGAFWPSVAALAGPRLRDWADYVGIDMYPDVFGGRIERAALVPAVDEILRTLRYQALPLAGIGRSTPIRVCENGWPTGPGRPEEEQAAMLDAVLRAVHDRRRELNVTHWELFALRDADSTRANPFHQFGIVRDDYSPKPAFERLRRTFAELHSG